MASVSNSSDKWVATCNDRVGFQPARYRLQTGKCYVGALARSLSPQHKGTRKTIGTGRMAEIHISNKTMEQDETDLDLVGNIDNHINI